MNIYIDTIISICLPNKYTKWYLNIIRSRQHKVNNNYVEKHHILPKSIIKELKLDLPPNHLDNLVELTPKEHFVCHKILVRMLEGKNKCKMSYAVHRLAYGNNGRKGSFVRFTSSQYANIRKQHSVNLSGAGNPMYGLTHSDETKKKISDKAKTRICSGETRQKLSLAMSGKNNPRYGRSPYENFTPEQKIKDSKRRSELGKAENNHFFGKKHSDSVKQHLSQLRKNAPKVMCIYCSKEFDRANHNRWHGNNCKLNCLPR